MAIILRDRRKFQGMLIAIFGKIISTLKYISVQSKCLYWKSSISNPIKGNLLQVTLAMLT